MRDVLAFCTLMACIAVVLFSTVALFMPMPQLKLGNRKKALKGFGIAFLLFISTALILDSGADPKADQASGKNTPADNEDAASKGDPKDKSASNSPALADEIKNLWGQFLGAVKPCDAMSRKVAEEAASADLNVYDFYSVVDKAANECSSARMAVSELEVPPSSEGDIRSTFSQALINCTDAYQAKAVGYAEMAKVVDGDNRPSKVAEVKQMSEAATAMQLQCVAGFFDAVSKAKLPAEILKTG